MKHIKYIGIFLLVICSSTSVMAQKSERDHIRRGNKLYNDSLFVKAEVEYRKALDANPKSTEALYNLGNALLMQQKAQEAMKQYETASKIETNKTKLAKIYHNAGVILQSGKQYPQCIEAYKQSLRNNPTDNETRYNLALAQKMLKDQQQNQKQDQQQDKNGQDQKEDKQKQQEQKQDKQNQDQKQQENKNQQQQENKDQMSKENAEQLLNAVMQDEKNVQEKVKKNLQMRGKKYDKDW
ncbi:tetratricopeptide repeat protein [Mediterranea sp. ET5]|uniref:tetratricopeptide repeat protein n=1 Tax=Mediterranea TaxID=1926659 RepID=UPI003978CA98